MRQPLKQFRPGHVIVIYLLLFFLLLLLVTTAPMASTVYIALGSANEVIAVDPATSTITARYTGVDNPHGLTATPDGEYLIAGSLTEKPVGGSGDMSSQLFLIHPVHGHVMSTIPVIAWSHHEGITPDGRYVLSTHPTKGGISVTDLNEKRMIKVIESGAAPNYILISSDGRRAYVSNSGAGTISEIDTKRWSVIRQLKAGPGPEHMTFSANERSIFVANPGPGEVTEVSIEAGEVKRRFNIGQSVHAVALSDDGKVLFASDKKGDRLVAIDLANKQQRSLGLSPAPYHLTAIRGTGKLYVSSRSQPLIWVVDQDSLKLIDQIDLGAGEGHQTVIIDG
jgi:YVTN family beta-propeller protein